MKKYTIPASIVFYEEETAEDNFLCTGCEEPIVGYAFDIISGKKQALSFAFCASCLGYTQKEFKQMYNEQEKQK